MIDLHSHSAASDGQFSAPELVHRAWRAGVRTLALTDHDTVAAIDDAAAAAAFLGLELVPGIELCSYVNGKEAHILGHFVDPKEPKLGGFSTFLADERRRRMLKMIEHLAPQGIEVVIEEVEAVSSGRSMGRPHLAIVLLEKGYVQNMTEAFERYLGPSRPGYVEHYKLSSREAIGLVRGAGGTATLAHAHLSGIYEPDVKKLKEEGLAGLEVFHSDHPPPVRVALSRLAWELDLVPTAGSDYHGELIAPGRHLGTVDMPRPELVRLKRRCPRKG